MTHIKDKIIRQYSKYPGIVKGKDGKRLDIPLPGESEDVKGKITMFFPGGPFLFNFIDIKSQRIPDIIANPGETGHVLKINYCETGRCELRLRNGECTYLTAGEIAVDAGQALNAFYYPTGEYRGFEIIVDLNRDSQEYRLFNERLSFPEDIYKKCKEFKYPWIKNADEPVSRMYESCKFYVGKSDSSELVLLTCLEMIAFLSRMDFNKVSKRRTYCTISQAEIAKRTKDIIMSDLSVRFTAKELAQKFGISETSLKNYFRNVYGCGYSEYQHTQRMKEAAKLLKTTDKKISDIGQLTGFATQAKFGVAFKNYSGVTPMEYRRRNRLVDTANAYVNERAVGRGIKK